MDIELSASSASNNKKKLYKQVARVFSHHFIEPSPLTLY